MGVGGGYTPPPSKSRKRKMKKETILEELERERQERWIKACQARARRIEDRYQRRKQDDRDCMLFILKMSPLCAFVAYVLTKLIA